MAAPPDGDPTGALDLPGAVAADRRGVLVDSERDEVPWRLEDERGREGLRPGVVVRDHRRPRDEREAVAPAQWPEEPARPEVEVAAGQDHRPGRAAGERRPTRVRGQQR